MKPALIIGSTCLDIIIDIDHLPKTQENIRPTSQTMALGGCAYNVAYMMKLLDAPFTLISPVGGGTYGDYVAKLLKASGFDCNIMIPDQENGCCYCFVEADGERTFMSYHGVEYSFQKEWMTPYPIENYSMVYVCGLEIEEETGINLVEYLEENPGPQLIFAPGPRGKLIAGDKMERLFNLHPVLHVNEKEARELSGCDSTEEAAAVLNRLTQNSVIVTLGEQGAYCLEKSGDSYTVAGNPAHVADTIGAGDSHIGTIMACLLKGDSLRTAVTKANRVSCAVVSIKGASLPPELLRYIFPANEEPDLF